MRISEISIETDIDLIPDRKLINSVDYRIGKKKYTFFSHIERLPLSLRLLRETSCAI